MVVRESPGSDDIKTKNSVIALIPATILADDIVTLEGVPDISDGAKLRF